VQVEAINIEGEDVLSRAGGVAVGSLHVAGYQTAGTIVEMGAEVTDRKWGSGWCRCRRSWRKRRCGRCR
jgi:NADPH:quinone reductase-like Zn-dependent oxidoreductase